MGASKSMTKVTYLTWEVSKDLEVVLHAVPAWHKARGRRILMCVALPPTHVGGCTLYVGRSTMDDGLLKIVDFEGKFMIRVWNLKILADNGCFGVL